MARLLARLWVQSIVFAPSACLLGCAKNPVSTVGRSFADIGENRAHQDAAGTSVGKYEPTRTEACGNGVVERLEACDDGNLTRGDGCDNGCRFEARLMRGHRHTCVVLMNGDVKCWGANEVGQLGYGDTRNRGDKSGEMGTKLPTVALGVGRTAVDLAIRGGHTCALLDDRSVKCWGWNKFGQLGYGDRRNRGDDPGEMGDALPIVDLGTGRTAVALALGATHSCALLDHGTVKCWGGQSQYDQLGYEGGGDRGDEPGEMGDSLPPVDIGHGQSAVGLAAGDDHTCAILERGRVKCWGPPGAPYLGYGKRNFEHMGDRLPFVDFGQEKTVTELSAGAMHTCALYSDGGVGCWGSGSFGQLGDSIDRNDCEPELPVNPLCRASPPRKTLLLGSKALKIEARHDETCSLLDSGTVKCWGTNQCGQFGQVSEQTPKCEDGTTSAPCLRDVPSQPIRLGYEKPAIDMALGASTVCVLFKDRRIKCWGCYNKNGELGYGDTKPRPQPTDEVVDY